MASAQRRQNGEESQSQNKICEIASCHLKFLAKNTYSLFFLHGMETCFGKKVTSSSMFRAPLSPLLLATVSREEEISGGLCWSFLCCHLDTIKIRELGRVGCQEGGGAGRGGGELRRAGGGRRKERGRRGGGELRRGAGGGRRKEQGRRGGGGELRRGGGQLRRGRGGGGELRRGRGRGELRRGRGEGGRGGGEEEEEEEEEEKRRRRRRRRRRLGKEQTTKKGSSSFAWSGEGWKGGNLLFIFLPAIANEGSEAKKNSSWLVTTKASHFW